MKYAKPVFAALLILGLVIYKLLFVRMVKLTEEVKIKNTMLIGFGLSLILQNIALKLWTADDRGVTTDYSGMVFTIGDIRFPVIRIASLLIAFIVVVVLQLVLKRTYIGKAIRATVEDWESASLMGVDVSRVYLYSFVVGVAMAGIAGTLISVSYSIEPSMGMGGTLKALIVMVLGGVGSFLGSFVGGIVLGVTESISTVFIPGSYRQVVGLLLFLLVLIFRPQGLFGQKER